MNEATKPTAYLLCGFIGSGKTTFARKLEKETGAIRFTKDEWSVKVFGHHNLPNDNFFEYDKKMAKLVTEIALRCLTSGASVIIDDGFWYREQRDQMRQTLKDIGVVIKFYYIDTPVGIINIWR